MEKIREKIEDELAIGITSCKNKHGITEHEQKVTSLLDLAKSDRLWVKLQFSRSIDHVFDTSDTKENVFNVKSARFPPLTNGHAAIGASRSTQWECSALLREPC